MDEGEQSEDVSASAPSEPVDAAGAPSPADGQAGQPASGRRWPKVLLRIAIVVGALGISMVVLFFAFDDLSFAEIADAVRSLDDAEWLSLGAMWGVWIACQGLQTASLVPKLPVRRGVLAYLGPAAVGSVIPGPSDLPVRFRMYTSWGIPTSQSVLAVAAGGLFTVGIKLVLPVIAAVGLVVSGAPLEPPLGTVVVIALAVGVGIVVFGFVVGSEHRTAKAGRLLDGPWRATARRLRRDDPEHLADTLLEARSRALSTLRGRWLVATWAVFITAASRCALLVMSLRFVGIPAEVLPWPQVFVVYALVEGLTAIPITAGNAGVSEVAYVGLLSAAAGTAYVNQVAAGVLIFRMLTWILVMPAGLAALGIWRHGMRRAAGRAGTA